MFRVFAIECASAAIGISAPILLKHTIDALGSNAAEARTVIIYTAAFVAASAGASAAPGFKLPYTMRIVDMAGRTLTLGVIRSQLPALAREKTGDSAQITALLERLPSSLQIVIDGILWRAVPILGQTLASLAVLSMLAPPRYAILLAASLASYALATMMGSKRFRETTNAAYESIAVQAQTLGDILRNARRVIANGAQQFELDLMDERLAARRKAHEGVGRLLSRTAILQFLTATIGLSALLSLSVFDIVKGRLTAGDFVLLQAYAFRLITPLGSFGLIFRQAGVSIANIGATLALIGPENAATRHSGDAPSGPGLVELNNLGFRYGDEWVFRGVNARIAPGSFTVIMGPNGSGKSTLAQLIAGILEPSEGEISINGRPLSKLDAEERRELVLYAPQTTTLFNRTLRENILYPPVTGSTAEIAALLNEWRFYDSGNQIDLDLKVGDQGERLSGGQVQKLELARLSYVRAPVVILDETTSALDSESEEHAIRSLRGRLKGRTTLILITHRTHIAEQADQVLILRGESLTKLDEQERLASKSC